MALGVAAAAGWAAGVPAGGQHAAEEAGTLNNMRPERQRTLDRAEWGRQGGQACCWGSCVPPRYPPCPAARTCRTHRNRAAAAARQRLQGSSGGVAQCNR